MAADGTPHRLDFAPVIPPSVYWGAWISGKTYGLPSDPPWDMTAVDLFESHAGKKISILHFGIPWYRSGHWPSGYYPFIPSLFDRVRTRGIIPLVDWGSWDIDANSKTDQPSFALSRITRGDHDAYIKQWAVDAKAWGYPLFLRFNWEMNGTWYPWSESRNTNAPGQFVTAWRHVHDIFKQTGATNVTWVWCPNTEYPAGLPLERLYPGDDYVDWVCADVYNSGTHPSKPDSWKSFDQVFNPTYAHLIKIAPSKPMMIAELGSTEVGGTKSDWVDDALTTQLSTTYSRIKAVLWFNWNADDMDWTIESSPAAQAAFARGISSRIYSSNDFRDLMGSPIAPLSSPETDRARR